MYIARDKDGTLSLWSHKPRRCEDAGIWLTQMCGSFLGVFESADLDNIDWSCEPVEVELVLHGERVTICNLTQNKKVTINR